MRECPHCHEDTFGARELFTLDYFHTDYCKNCWKSVRNDGLRQLFVVPAVLAAVVPTILIMYVIPEALEPFAFLLILVLIAVPIILLAKPVKAEPRDVTLSPFSPNLRNDKVIMVSGWNEGELRKILDGFIAEADTDSPACRIEVQKQYENHFRLTFPEDIHPSLFASLVNYVMYPIELRTTAHSLAAVGKMTLDVPFSWNPEIAHRANSP